jgi:hypothetical protein
MKNTNVAVLAAAGPSDALTEQEQPRPLLPGGRWLFDLIVPALTDAGFGVPAVMPTSSGYWVLTVHGEHRRFDLVVSDISPIFVLEIRETRSLGERLRRAPRDPVFHTAFKAVCEAVRSDARVGEVLTFSGEKRDGDAFVGRAIEKLERDLGIYSR